MSISCSVYSLRCFYCLFSLCYPELSLYHPVNLPYLKPKSHKPFGWWSRAVAWWICDSVCNRSVHGRFTHQIKHLNNYCLIYCCGRRACGLIKTRLERETEASTAHSSLLIVSPSGPQVTLTTLLSLQRRT